MQFRNLFHIPCHGTEADITGNSHGYPASPHRLVTSDKIRRTPEQPVDFKRSWGHPFPKNHEKQRRASPEGDPAPGVTETDMQRNEIHELLTAPYEEVRLKADAVRRATLGDHVRTRGLIEFSNRCICNCKYCGLRRANTHLHRYLMPRETIMAAVDAAVAAGTDTIVLQSGEDPSQPAAVLAGHIEAIKTRHPHMAVTLGVGERSRADYALWRRAGADRFLIKHETANPELYARLHPGRTLAERLRALADLADLGYVVGSGFIVGVPGQTLEDIVEDILLVQHLNVGMCGAGPFIPQRDTPFHEEPRGSVPLTLHVMSVLRLALPHAHLPATTALATLDPVQGQCDGLRAGGDVLMPSFTPALYRGDYRIYDNKKRVGIEEAIAAVRAAGRTCSLTTENAS